MYALWYLVQINEVMYKKRLCNISPQGRGNYLMFPSCPGVALLLSYF